MPDTSLYDDISLEKVVQDREFYKSKNEYYFEAKKEREGDKRLRYGIYLMRVEMFRLRAKLVGLQESFIQENAPEFVEEPLRGDADHRRAVLLQQAEYLRAELIIQAANARRHSNEFNR